MPKNKGKGGKTRRRGIKDEDVVKRELIFKDAQQEYACVTKMLGSGHLEAICFDGEKRLCHIRGKLRKKVWIDTGDLILISLRDFQAGRADVILKYTPEEARNLKSYGELPQSSRLNELSPFMEDGMDGEVSFEDDHSLQVEEKSETDV